MAKSKIPPRTLGSDKDKKAAARRRISNPRGDTNIPQIDNLRRAIENLRARLEREAKARGDQTASRRDVRKTSHPAIDTLGKRGAKLLSGQLKRALQNADQRDETRRLALAKIAELRAQLPRGHD